MRTHPASTLCLPQVSHLNSPRVVADIWASHSKVLSSYVGRPPRRCELTLTRKCRIKALENGFQRKVSCDFGWGQLLGKYTLLVRNRQTLEKVQRCWVRFNQIGECGAPPGGISAMEDIWLVCSAVATVNTLANLFLYLWPLFLTKTNVEYYEKELVKDGSVLEKRAWREALPKQRAWNVLHV